MLPAANLFQACSQRHLLICLLYFVFAMGLTWVTFRDGFETSTFGFEYGNIAESMALGHGFSGVFEGKGIPTAWCPPFYVFIHFLIFKIFGIKTIAAMWAALVLQVLLLTWTLNMLLKLTYTPVLNQFKVLILPIFSILSTFILLYEFGDIALNVFLSMATLTLVIRIREEGFAKYRGQALLLALILPLSNLFLFIAIGALIIANLVQALLNKTHPVPVKSSLLILAIMVTSMTGWGLRNLYTMGRFIPFKSNLWIEVYMSNVKDSDGILKQSSWYAYHPSANHIVQQKYNTLGELAFLEPYRDSSVHYLRENPGDFLTKVAKRAVNTFFFMTTSNDVIEFDSNRISHADIRFLEEKKLVVYSYWTCLEMTPNTFRQIVGKMDLTNRGNIIKDWEQKKRMLNQRIFHSPARVIAGLLVTFVPFLSLFLCFVNRKVRSTPVLRFTVLLLAFSLGPYTLISHYLRYQAFQIGFFTILIFMSLELVLRKSANTTRTGR